MDRLEADLFTIGKILHETSLIAWRTWQALARLVLKEQTNLASLGLTYDINLISPVSFVSS